MRFINVTHSVDDIIITIDGNVEFTTTTIVIPPILYTRSYRYFSDSTPSPKGRTDKPRGRDLLYSKRYTMVGILIWTVLDSYGELI